MPQSKLPSKKTKVAAIDANHEKAHTIANLKKENEHLREELVRRGEIINQLREGIADE